MNESESKNEKPKEGHRFDPELLKKGLRCDLDQYEMLKRCSDKKDMTEWNEWRKAHPTEDILLEGADLKDAYLEGANLIRAKFCPESERGHTTKGFLKVYSRRIANLQGANIGKARLKNAVLNGAHLKGADMSESCLQQADLMFAELEGAMLLESGLCGCVLQGANIKGADITRCDLRNANFRAVIVDDATVIWKPEVNKCRGPGTHKNRIGEHEYTDFQGVPLDSIRTDPRTKQLLEYNIRRFNWERWYLYEDWEGECIDKRCKIQRILLHFIRLFWSVSDYGRSTGGIVLRFFGLALFFAVIYGICAWLWPPGIVNNLDIEPHLPLWHYFLLVLLRPVYFSIVTMTTLGFGDMHANPESIWGHVLLTIQVILGYVLLGALVTRFAVLFTAGGPAGKFAEERKKKATDNLARLRFAQPQPK